MKQIIRLTESDLHKLVKESVKKIIREMDGDDFVSPLQRTRNARKAPIGQIKNFDPNKSYGSIGGNYVENRRIMDVAKKKLISIISKPFSINVASQYYGYFYGETPDGWKFEIEDIPLEVVIDSPSSYRPATWWDPEEWNDAEYHVEPPALPDYIYFCPPGGDWQPIQFDAKIKELFLKNADPDEDVDGDIIGDAERDYFDNMPEPDYERDDDW